MWYDMMSSVIPKYSHDQDTDIFVTRNDFMTSLRTHNGNNIEI